MVTKQCAVCNRYFSGDFDGNYTCADCLRVGAVRRRPLTALGAPSAVWAGGESGQGLVSEPGVEAPGPDSLSARGQAA